MTIPFCHKNSFKALMIEWFEFGLLRLWHCRGRCPRRPPPIGNRVFPDGLTLPTFGVTGFGLCGEGTLSVSLGWVSWWGCR